MFRTVDVLVKSWVDVTGKCSITYYHQGKESVTFAFGDPPNEFEFGFDLTSLRAFLEVGAMALAELEQGRSPR